MGSGQSLAGSSVQQTHNCAGQHLRHALSPRGERPAGRQCSTRLRGHPSTVACGPNNNRQFKQPSSFAQSQLPASVRSLILLLMEDHGVMGVPLPSFCPPAGLGPLPTSRAKLTFREFRARLDAARRQVLRQQVLWVLLAADRVESERSLGQLLVNPQRQQVDVSLFPQSSSLGDSPCGRRVAVQLQG